jgi:hypothetical protein
MGITQQRGLEGETAVLNRLIRLGYEVLHPWNRSLGYDLAYLVEKKNVFLIFLLSKRRNLYEFNANMHGFLKMEHA